MENLKYTGPILLDKVEEFSLEEFTKQIVATGIDRVFYSYKKLFMIDFESINAVLEDGSVVIVDIINYASYTRVDGFKFWLIYNFDTDEVFYTNSLEKAKGSSVVIPVIRTRDRFIKTVERAIRNGKYRSFVGGGNV